MIQHCTRTRTAFKSGVVSGLACRLLRFCRSSFVASPIQRKSTGRRRSGNCQHKAAATAAQMTPSVLVMTLFRAETSAPSLLAPTCQRSAVNMCTSGIVAPFPGRRCAGMSGAASRWYRNAVCGGRLQCATSTSALWALSCHVEGVEKFGTSRKSTMGGKCKGGSFEK